MRLIITDLPEIYEVIVVIKLVDSYTMFRRVPGIFINSNKLSFSPASRQRTGLSDR